MPSRPNLNGGTLTRQICGATTQLSRRLWNSSRRTEQRASLWWIPLLDALTRKASTTRKAGAVLSARIGEDEIDGQGYENSSGDAGQGAADGQGQAVTSLA